MRVIICHNIGVGEFILRAFAILNSQVHVYRQMQMHFEDGNINKYCERNCLSLEIAHNNLRHKYSTILSS